MNVFQFFIICKRTNNANNATHYVKLGKKRRESSKRNYYIISPRVMIKAIIINARQWSAKESLAKIKIKQEGEGSCGRASEEVCGRVRRAQKVGCCACW